MDELNKSFQSSQKVAHSHNHGFARTYLVNESKYLNETLQNGFILWRFYSSECYYKIGLFCGDFISLNSLKPKSLRCPGPGNDNYIHLH